MSLHLVQSPNAYQQRLCSLAPGRHLVLAHRRAGTRTGIALAALHRAESAPGSETLLATPDDRQCESLRETLKVISQSPLFTALALRSLSAPVLEFKNGSRIRVLSGGGLRGTAPADFAVFSQPYHADPACVQTLIDLNANCTLLIGQVPPSGLVPAWYAQVRPETGWTEYHLPITQNPLYEEADLARLRAKCSERQWLTEYLCEMPSPESDR